MQLPTRGAVPREASGHRIDGRYELFDRVGRGPVSEVYRAWDHRLERVVAVKTLDPGSDPEVLRAFLEDGRATASLPPHPHVVPVYEVGQDGKTAYIVSEYVSGGSLKELENATERIPAGQALPIVRQVADGLDFARQFGLLHLNLKPQNVVISRSGTVKVTDFAPHRAAVARQRIPSTLAYRAPECDGNLGDVRCDVFALAAVVFEMLTGLPPGHSIRALDSDGTIAQQDLPATAPPAPAMAPLLKALAWEPDRRYSSAGAFAAALHRGYQSERGDTPRAVPLAAPQKPVRLDGAPPGLPIPVPVRPPPSKGRSRIPGLRALRSLHLTFMSIFFLAVLLVAAGGGWLAYGAITRALDSWGFGPSPSHANHQRAASTSTKHRATARTVKHPSHPAAVPQHPAPACGVNTAVPVRLTHVWASSVHVAPGQPVRFDYTVDNPAPQCSKVGLGLALVPAGGGPPVTLAAHEPVVAAQPGSHTYHRQVAIPSTATGPYTVTWTLEDPGRTVQFGSISVPSLITVASS